MQKSQIYHIVNNLPFYSATSFIFTSCFKIYKICNPTVKANHIGRTRVSPLLTMTSMSIAFVIFGTTDYIFGALLRFGVKSTPYYKNILK